MAFGEDLLKALSATQYKAADSPYAIGSQAISAISPNLVNPYGSTGSNLAITAGSGMLAALLAGLAENDAKSQNAAFAPSISAFLKADPTQQAQLAAKEPRLSSLYNTILANSWTNEEALKQEEAKFNKMTPLENQAAVDKENLLNPIRLDQQVKEQNALSPLRVAEKVNEELALKPYKLEDEFRQQVATLKGAEGVAITPDNKFIQVTDPMKREITLDAEKLKNQLLAKEGITRTASGQEEKIPQPKQEKAKYEEDLKDLQTRFNNHEAVKQYVQVRPAVEAMVGALKDNGIVSDQELSRYGILLIEPGMAVREGEQGAILNSQSVPQAWKGQMQRALKGESGLQPEVREGLKRLAIRAYEGRLKNYQDTLKFFKNEAKNKSLDENRIAFLGEGYTVDQVFGGNTQQSAALQELKRRGLVP